MATKILSQDIDTSTTFNIAANQFGDGTGLLPSLTFSSDTNTGVFRRGSDLLAFTAGGVDSVQVGTSGLEIYNGKVLFNTDGTAANPSYAFSSDPNTGIYSGGADQLAFSSGGVLRGRFTTAGLNVDSGGLFINAGVIQNQLGSAAAPSFTFIGDTNTGLFSDAADRLQVSLGGTEKFRFGATQHSSAHQIIVSTALDAFMQSETTDNDKVAMYKFTNTAATHRIGIETANDAGGGAFAGGPSTFNIETNSAHSIVLSTNSTKAVEITSAQRALFSDGTAALPGMAFINDPDTGIYRPGANQVYFATNGVVRMGIDSAGNVYNPGVYYTESGSAAAPAISFNGDTDTGIYRSNPNQLTLVANGSTILSAYAARIESHTEHRFQDGSVAVPGINFVNDTDTGIFRGGANTLDIACNGATQLEIAPTYCYINPQIRESNGSATAPSYSFNSEVGLGIYRSGASAIGFAFGTVLGADMNFGTGYFDMRNNLLIATSAGSASTPSIANRNNLDTGLYWPSDTQLTFGSDASPVVSFLHTNSIDWGVYLHSGYWISIPDGTAALPVFHWDSDVDTGIYRIAADRIGFSAGGASRFEVRDIHVQSEVVHRFASGSAASPALQFISSTNTGLFYDGSNRLGLSTGGVQNARFDVVGATDGVTYQPYTFFGGNQFGGGGAPNSTSYSIRTTASVSTTPVVIGGSEYGFIVVSGATAGGANIFTDLLLSHYSQTPTVVSSKNSNSPAARTYGLSGDNITLQMASGTYNIAFSFFKTPLR